MSPEERDTHQELVEMRESVKDLENKDRKTEIVFIGQNINKKEIINVCEITLLSSQEDSK
jgi:ATP:corrinoid adenosyltransferase